MTSDDSRKQANKVCKFTFLLPFTSSGYSTAESLIDNECAKYKTIVRHRTIFFVHVKEGINQLVGLRTRNECREVLQATVHGQTLSVRGQAFVLIVQTLMTDLYEYCWYKRLLGMPCD